MEKKIKLHKLIGMPFYNKENRESVFEEKFKNI
jgi:hypothetical protein